MHSKLLPFPDHPKQRSGEESDQLTYDNTIKNLFDGLAQVCGEARWYMVVHVLIPLIGRVCSHVHAFCVIGSRFWFQLTNRIRGGRPCV